MTQWLNSQSLRSKSSAVAIDVNAPLVHFLSPRISTLIIAAIIVAVLASSPGWKTTQETFFNWEYARQAIPAVLSGMWLNIRMLLVAATGVAIFATLLAATRTLAGPVFFPLRFLAAAYTDIFRGSPSSSSCT